MSETTDDDQITVTVETKNKPQFTYTHEIGESETEEEARERALSVARSDARQDLEDTASGHEWVEAEEDQEPLALDEKDEVYGYGVYNVRENCFVEKLGGGRVNSDTFDREEAIEHFEDLDVENKSHLRIVRVVLDNSADREAAGLTGENDE